MVVLLPLTPERALADTRAEVWPAVKVAIMKYLEAGESWRKDHSWPLPVTGLKSAEPRWKPQFPMTDVLIDIAISEKKTEDVPRWHDASKSGRGARASAVPGMKRWLKPLLHGLNHLGGVCEDIEPSSGPSDYPDAKTSTGF